MMKNIISGILLLAGLAGILSSCDPDVNFITGDAVDLRLELDTLRFDTVFTQLGSATRSVKIYNNGADPVKVDAIYVEGRTGVKFNINVDGVATERAEEVIIWGNDSIYVFVEVTVDPDAPVSSSPFVVEDALVVENGSRKQQVLLEAWGQNANYFPSRFNKGVPVVLSCDNGEIVWDSPLPYVIYGEIFIDSCLLRLPAGTRIYVHGGLAQNEVFGIFNDGFLYTLSGGSIRAEGTKEQPVILQTDRLEPAFAEQPGQWLGLIFGQGSQGNVLEHTIIKNSNFGVYADSAAQLTLRNSIIHHTAGSGILARHSTINAGNCLLYANASNAVQLTHGGNYTFDHCTVANYGVDASALALTNYQCYNDDCTVNDLFPLLARFRNCIFVGSRADEIILEDATERDEPTFFQLSMENCLVKTDQLLTRLDGRYADFFSSYCLNCINGENNDALFLDRAENDYHLDTLSVAQNRGLVLPLWPLDLDGITRDNMPDLGCYERVD